MHSRKNSVQDSGASDAFPMENRAFPTVLPIKAALYFDNADGFGEWRLLMSTRATQDLRHAFKTNAAEFNAIIKKMEELSRGQFSDGNQKRLNGSGMDIPIYEARVTGDQRLVYQVDCVPEDDSDVPMEHQVLRIFGIYTHAQLDNRLWDSIGRQLARKDKDYRRRCNFRIRLSSSDYIYKPASFPQALEVDAEPPNPSVLDLPREELDELHSLMLDKFVALSQALLNSIIADTDAAHVFSMAPQEKEIVEHNSSCYVLGRSGTGKTTTMLFKMLGIERAWQLQATAGERQAVVGGGDTAVVMAGLTKPRQVFVTQSRVLADKVQEYFAKLMESLATASCSPQELADIAKKHLEQVRADNKDGGEGEEDEEEGESLFDPDDEINWRKDLPGRFSLLEEKHFPLFLTFDKLCKLLEADLDQKKLSGRGGRQRQSRLSMITYSIFLQSYWPRFPQLLTKGLDPSLVFSEFMGVIKGSVQALDSTDRCLNRQTYETLSYRTQSRFAGQRGQIYTLFMSYVKRKQEMGHYDGADRTHWILTDMLAHGVTGRIDFLYVDEVQDNLLIDALLLRSLCGNQHGLFWAGDTAQTISMGSSFRFDDLKAFLYEVERKMNRTPVEPRFFQLAINYRSHGGIVSCAHSVVEIITQLWPYAIDMMPKERGRVDGPKPIFFNDEDDSSESICKQFFSDAKFRLPSLLFKCVSLLTTDLRGNQIGPGAHQCILVRDIPARDRLKAQFKKPGVIMTVYDSKGLEFDDVLLYNFFKDSIADVSQWRVILNALNSASSISALAPRFCDTRHACVCSELKILYVAITRAKKNLWILDCSERSEPMQVFWSSKNKIDVHPPGAEMPCLVVTSSNREWASTGERLFKNKNFQEAMDCFARAGMHRKSAVAEANYIREIARTLPRGSRKHYQAFLDAANAFDQCARAATTGKGKQVYFGNAARCYLAIGDIQQAAQAFLVAPEYKLAAEHYRDAGMFGTVVQIIEDHRDKMEPQAVIKLRNACRLHYFKENQFEQAMALFSSNEEALKFVGKRNLHFAQARLLEQMGRFREAGEVHLAADRTLEAIQLFLKEHDYPGCAQKAIDATLQGLWSHLSFGVFSLELDKELEHLFAYSAQLDPQFMKAHDLDEIKMFKAIVSKKSEELERLGRHFAQIRSKAAALLCLDHVFKDGSMLQELNMYTLTASLELFFVYASLLRDFALISDPHNDPLMRKLFNFKPSNDGSSFVRKVPSSEGPSETRTILRETLTGLFDRSLRQRLRRVVLRENNVFFATKLISPCYVALAGTCNKSNCHKSHVNRAFLNRDWYNKLIRVHLQQVLILHTWHSLELESGQQTRQSRLLERLYEVLNPGLYILGSPANLVLYHIPEAKRALEVVDDWVRQLIRTLDPQERPTFLTTFLRAASLTFAIGRPHAVSSILRAPYVKDGEYPRLLASQLFSKRYVIHDVLGVLHGGTSQSMSSGVLFISYVVRERPPVDISVLCDFLEFICASVVIFRRYQDMSVPHGIILPRSWLLPWSKFLTTVDSRGRNKNTYITFADSIIALLHRVKTKLQGLDHLLFQNCDLFAIDEAVKDIFVFRICKALCLLGYNIKDEVLRDNICVGITSLPTNDCNSSFLYRRYTEAKNWDDLVSAVQQSTTESPMDGLVCLYHKDKVEGPLPPINGVRYVLFKTAKEIPSLLGYNISNMPLISFSRQGYSSASKSSRSAGPHVFNLHLGTKSRHSAALQVSRAARTVNGENDLANSNADGGDERAKADDAEGTPGIKEHEDGHHEEEENLEDSMDTSKGYHDGLSAGELADESQTGVK